MKKNKINECYESPNLEFLDILVEQGILQMSGYGRNSDDSEFGETFGW